ncbi:receptor tyrosine-protein kinase erbB-2-like [Ptychodera flava]|uniref:receptor tyrosine-protein kinase erbB-2-like n=1 Tax=Ptychodera flava TaxID=63121 RepID=UPI00396A91C8
MTNRRFHWNINDDLIGPRSHVVYIRENNNAYDSYATLEVIHASTALNGKYECRVRDQSGVEYSDVGYAQISGCLDNRWGEDCENVCACLHAESCDQHVGCMCHSGWKGRHCNEVCPNGFYSRNCSDHCLCEIKATISCDPELGQCNCSEGYCGELCEQKCNCEAWEVATCEATSCFCEKVSSPPKHLVGDEILIIFLTKCVGIAVITLLIGLLCYRRMKENLRKYRRLNNDQEEIHEIMREHIGQRDKWSVGNARLRKSQILLGQGSSGQVHKGYFKPKGSKIVEEVAIKSLVPGGITYKSYMDFASEIRCLMKLNGNLNIVTFKGFILQRDDKCFLMESAPRGDLLNHLRCHGNNILREKSTELLLYTQHITRGMQYMKSKQILHRDLSSRNILLFDDNVAKISDFGLSRDVSESCGKFVETPWSEGQTALPLRWMPPEFLTRGEFHFKSDVWSFGVLFWEVGALGAVPFEDDDSYKFIRRIARGEMLPKPQICTDEAYQIMCKCWARPLEMRPSAKQLTVDIELLMEDKGLFTAKLGSRKERKEMLWNEEQKNVIGEGP